MLVPVALSLIAAFSTAATSDTVIPVEQGARLNVNNFGGDIVVQAWSKNSLHITADHSERVRMYVVRTGPNLDVKSSSRHGIPARIDYTIQAPAWMPLTLSGVYGDISVEGCKCE